MTSINIVLTNPERHYCLHINSEQKLLDPNGHNLAGLWINTKGLPVEDYLYREINKGETLKKKDPTMRASPRETTPIINYYIFKTASGH